MTRALRRTRSGRIKFVPQCLTPSFERHVRFSELVRIHDPSDENHAAYAPHLWQPGACWASAMFVLVFFGGLGFVLARALPGLSFATPAGPAA